MESEPGGNSLAGGRPSPPSSNGRKLRIAQLAPPVEAVPPIGYGGTERVIADLVKELIARGHDVTLFASADSTARARIVPTAPAALRPAGDMKGEFAYTINTILEVARRGGDFDIVHAHLEWSNLILPRVVQAPVVMTFHGRLDYDWAAASLAYVDRGLVAISNSQASFHPDAPWEGVVHNGLDLSGSPFERNRTDALCFVGRIAPEKGVVEAIDIAARVGRKLRIAAKQGVTQAEREYFENVFRPALSKADVEYLGELPAKDRDRLLTESYATLMPGSWPEPFGLVTIESLACGTPVVARRVGALPEIVREGVDGFFGDDGRSMAHFVEQVGKLDRAAIRASVLQRFSAARMADDYEAVYHRMIGRLTPPRAVEVR